MNKGVLNENFLNSINKEFKEAILQNVSYHYKISTKQAYLEIIDKDAENILEYLNNEIRVITKVYYNKFVIKFMCDYHSIKFNN
jgi:uncharacterized FlaG/YvyC family protein